EELLANGACHVAESPLDILAILNEI
ncbi:MAG TPA: phosphoglycolate phosphatase, partial [Butyricimonas virosa]|nr:phosphoglycolate phosphatase [Butyricimonas virosa]